MNEFDNDEDDNDNGKKEDEWTDKDFCGYKVVNEVGKVVMERLKFNDSNIICWL